MLTMRENEKGFMEKHEAKEGVQFFFFFKYVLWHIMSCNKMDMSTSIVIQIN